MSKHMNIQLGCKLPMPTGHEGIVFERMVHSAIRHLSDADKLAAISGLIDLGISRTKLSSEDKAIALALSDGRIHEADDGHLYFYEFDDEGECIAVVQLDADGSFKHRHVYSREEVEA